MNKILFSLLFLIPGFAAMACEVHLPSHVLILGGTAEITKAAQTSDCSAETLLETNETLKSVEGKITSFQLAEILKSKNHNVLIQPHLIHIQQLKSLIREQMLIPAGVQLHSSQAVNSSDFIALNYGERVEVLCTSCVFNSHQAININITGIDGNKKSLTVMADFRKMVKAYRVTSFHPAFSEITTHSLKEEFVEAIPHTDLITDLASLRFYKLNKPVRAGELLRQADLTALSLVKAGVKTDVIIENELVMLKTSGISRGNGAIGEYVEVFHPQKNKKYYGKVIDINKVLVEL